MVVHPNNNISDNADEIIGHYRPGSIQRIKLHNFLTHGNVEFQPGPRLNMVIGANGTGKSTILNAICLGLGGEPKLLGRADDVRAFIMHGKDEALIEIELTPFDKNNNTNYYSQDPDNDNAAATTMGTKHIIRRQIDRFKGSEKGKGRGASTFYINGEKVNIQTVRDLVCNTYNIQIDNLCTFLPQDKVGNFSGLSDQDRLLETEKTLPHQQFFYKRHMELIEKEEEMNNDRNNVDSITDLLKRKTHELERLEISKQHEEDRKRAEEELQLLQKKKLWLMFDAAREKCIELKEQKDQLKTQLKAHHEAIVPLEQHQQQIATQHKEILNQCKGLEEKCALAQKEMDKQFSKIEKHDDEIEAAISNYLQSTSKRERLEVQYNEANTKLLELEEQLKTCPPVEQFQQKYDKAQEMIRSFRKEYENAKREERQHKDTFNDIKENAERLQNKLVKLNDDGAQRRGNVFRQIPHLETICKFIQEHQRSFHRPVWGPIVLDVTTKSQNAAAYLEHHVPRNTLKSFVVETLQDHDFLYNEIREKLGIPINIISVEGIALNTTRVYSEQKMDLLKNRYGVEGYLDETFTAPDPVMKALQQYASVHKVLVGGEKAQKAIDKDNLLGVLTEPDTNLNQRGSQGSCIFTTSEQTPYRYTQSVSSYSGKVGTRVDQAGPAKLLAPGVPIEQKKLVENELKALHDQLSQIRPYVIESEKNVQELEGQLQQCDLQGKSFRLELENRNKFQGKVDRQKQRVEDAYTELQSSNIAEEKNELSKSIANRLVHSVAAIKTHGEQHKMLLQYTAINAGLTINLTNIRAADRQAQEEVREKRNAFAELEQRAELISRQFNNEKAQLKKMKAEADSSAPLYDDDGNETPLKVKLDAMEVTTIIEVEAAMEDAERLILQYGANPEVIQQYNKLKDEIDDIESQLAQFTDAREERLQGLFNNRRDWEDRLESYINKINSLFTVYMAEMGCTGEVRLTKGPPQDNVATPKDNFRQWGLEIRVSFREGCKAEVLSAQRHSGGERSVSTILYLMALQDMMIVPFRCVDEINQGLDERNERLVFKRIVANSCRPPKKNLIDHSGQYFLITPKLLPNLTAMEEEAMTILFVFNGPFNFKSPTEWNMFLDEPLPAIEVTNDDENSDNISSVPRHKAKKSRLS